MFDDLIINENALRNDSKVFWKTPLKQRHLTKAATNTMLILKGSERQQQFRVVVCGWGISRLTPKALSHISENREACWSRCKLQYRLYAPRRNYTEETQAGDVACHGQKKQTKPSVDSIEENRSWRKRRESVKWGNVNPAKTKYTVKRKKVMFYKK